MYFSKKAQSVIEYSWVIILVAAGILIMGPYVVRSINAHFKMWEDSVHDSQNDPLVDPASPGGSGEGPPDRDPPGPIEY